MTGPRQNHACDVPSFPHGLKRARLYPAGWRCDRHTPRALQGLPEIPTGPGMPAGAWSTLSPLSASRVADERAIASGKRRSSPEAYRAAQQAVHRTT